MKKRRRSVKGRAKSHKTRTHIVMWMKRNGRIDERRARPTQGQGDTHPGRGNKTSAAITEEENCAFTRWRREPETFAFIIYIIKQWLTQTAASDIRKWTHKSIKSCATMNTTHDMLPFGIPSAGLRTCPSPLWLRVLQKYRKMHKSN